jgi:hypothetical protein
MDRFDRGEIGATFVDDYRLGFTVLAIDFSK